MLWHPGCVDPATRTNLLIFGTGLLVLAAIWLVILGFAGGGVLQVVAGVACAAGAVAVFRVYLRGRGN